MKRVMTRCPETGAAIPTGFMAEDASDFARTPVFIARAACPLCRRDHDWFARDAWVEDSARANEEVGARLRSEAA